VSSITSISALDVPRIKSDFPVFEELFDGQELAYLDSANSSQKPRQVLEGITEFYEHSYANVHRAVYELGERATAGYEGAREKTRTFLGADSTREIIFTRNGTEALNLVAHAWGLSELGPGDVVVSTVLEHHSNFVPWQYVAKRTGAEFAVIGADGNGELDLEQLDAIGRRGRVRLVAFGLISNSIGTVNPVEALVGWAREHGAVTVVDGCQAAPHRSIDVSSLGVDFLALTGHKMLAPSGIGVLWGRQALLNSMEPFNLGGEMIRSVTIEESTWNELPNKFEAGTPPIAQAYGLGLAIDYLTDVGLERIEAHEHDLTTYAMESLADAEGVSVLGPPAERRGGIVSFTLDSAHPHDVAQILDSHAVAVRAGHHCTQPAMDHFGIPATTRASFYLYNARTDVDRLVEALADVRATFA
jgi:cysteine desulfurase/selenocysteine lyase